MNFKFRSLACLLITLCCARSLSAATIEVVVPAQKPSRPAHFNWEFKSANGQPAQLGQFACGSYWVAPAAGDTGVTFVSLTGNPAWQDLLSCDADPVTEKHGLLNGSNKYGSHDPAENVLPKLPITYTPAAGSCISLVAAMQRNEPATSPGGTKAILGECVDAYSFVTVLGAAPKDGGKNAIRPNITGATKELLTWDDFDLDRLPSHDFLKGRTDEQWEAAARRWRHSTEMFGIAAEVKNAKGQLDFTKFSEGGRAFRSMLVIDDYASGVAVAFNADALALFSPESTLEQKKPALAAMISYGLDTYHARYDIGQTARKMWSTGAGQSLGQFMPAVLAASLRKDESMAHQLRKAAATNQGDDEGEYGPHELRQITRGRTGVLLWGDYSPIPRPQGAKSPMTEGDWRYWADFTGSKCYDSYAGDPKNAVANRGKKTAMDPYGYIDGPANKPGTSYMGVAAGPMQSFAAIMILMPEVRSVVNSDATIEYIDRLTRHGLWTWPDPVAAPAKVDQDTARTWHKVEGAAEWGKTWGVDPNDVRLAIEDGKGRFKSLHGEPIKFGYTTGEARDNWAKIIALYDGPKFEERVVDLGVVVAPEIVIATGEKPQAYLSTPTLDAKIHYTLDGTEPTPSSPIYDGKPVTITATTQVKAMAAKEGLKPSAVRTKAVPKPLNALK